jgi:hypothetical protein
LATTSLKGGCIVQVNSTTSPEQAIKIAYDFARNLRINGVAAADLPHLLANNVEKPYSACRLLIYLRAGFVAGFDGQALPWRREIEAKGLE